MLIAAGVLGATRRRIPRDRDGPLPKPIDRGRQLGVWLCRTSLAATAMFALSAVRISGQFRPYLLAGAAGAGLALWSGVAGGARGSARSGIRVDVGRRRRSSTSQPPRSPRTWRRAGTPARARGAQVLKVAWELERDGVRVGAHGPFDERFSDRQRRYHDDRAIEVWVVTPADPLPRGCEPVDPYADSILCVVR